MYLLTHYIQAWTEYPASCHCLASLVLSASGATLSGSLGQLLPVVLRYWLKNFLLKNCCCLHNFQKGHKITASNFSTKTTGHHTFSGCLLTL